MLGDVGILSGPASAAAATGYLTMLLFLIINHPDLRCRINCNIAVLLCTTRLTIGDQLYFCKERLAHGAIDKIELSRAGLEFQTPRVCCLASLF